MKHKSLHKSCRYPGEGQANLEVAICNLKLVIPTPSGAEGEGSAARRKMQIPHSARDDKVWGIWSAGMEDEKCGLTAAGYYRDAVTGRISSTSILVG